mmetsp:Transcript_45496/g.33270  ORF Transcript_45496/g.33270 Transcript_45496/m.33270 type:complete len:192 (+) Transcript_45496:468-1043(+)
MDSTGIRMVSGGLDFFLKMWDLTTMNKKLRSFKEYKPFEGHPLTSLDFSPSDELLLITCGSHSAKIQTREGAKVQATIRGDMYISDVANTKGHVAAICEGKWHRVRDGWFVTGSADGSVRVWDVESKPVGVEQLLMQDTVMKVRSDRGVKVAVTSIGLSEYAQFIGAGCNDGSVQVFDARSKMYHRPLHWL